jgi:hypothetical protein
MKTEIYVPTKLSEIPLQNYQKFMKVINNSNDQEFIAEKTIEIFCGLNLKEVVKIKWSDVKDLALHFNKLFQEKPKFQSTFKIQNMEFGFIPNLDEITFGEYIDLESNITSVDNFHKAMAVMYRPIKTRVKDKYEIISIKNYNDSYPSAKSCLPNNGTGFAASDFVSGTQTLVPASLTSAVVTLLANTEANAPGRIDPNNIPTTFTTNSATLRKSIQNEYCFYYVRYMWVLNDILSQATSTSTLTSTQTASYTL